MTSLRERDAHALTTVPGPRPFVIGTAGHVDHGKSTLVKALTGIDPDRLAEEKARAMTIDLGFAWLTLPDGQSVSVVDVPGHERFIKNMLAGVGGIDAALLIIAADEGPMPQTEEHLAILDLLGIERGVIVLTKADTVDDEWLHLVEEEVRERVARHHAGRRADRRGLGAHRRRAAGVTAGARHVSSRTPLPHRTVPLPGCRSIGSSPSPASAPSSPARSVAANSRPATSCVSTQVSARRGCEDCRATRQKSRERCQAVALRSTFRE